MNNSIDLLVFISILCNFFICAFRLFLSDKFILQSDGVGRIVGRKKDIIIRGGENIFPREIEDFLDTHEDIVEAHVNMDTQIILLLRILIVLVVLTCSAGGWCT